MNKPLLLSAACLALGVSTQVHAEDPAYAFYITDFSHHHLANDQTEFSVTFSTPPKLQVFDFATRAEASFQYYILPYAGEVLPPPTSYAYIFRAPEGPDQASTLRVRKGHSPTGGTPGSGGWGAITEEVPLHIDGTTITFTLNNASFGYAPGKDLRYAIASYVFGTTSNAVTNVPEPQAFALLAAGVLAVATTSRLRRRQDRAQA